MGGGVGAAGGAGSGPAQERRWSRSVLSHFRRPYHEREKAAKKRESLLARRPAADPGTSCWLVRRGAILSHQPRAASTRSHHGYCRLHLPHDCPSTCALEVERIDARTIGRVHGAKENSYTDGVICAKVARYAERVHHPDRLAEPLRRTGPKGSGAFAPIGWDEALDEVAERFMAAAERYGPESVWPYFYAGTMGLVQRDGIDRLRHVMKYSRQKSTICTTLARSGWKAGTGACLGVDAREMAESDLIIVWGGQRGCDPGQRDDPHRQGAEDAGRPS